ncbi:MAG: cytochrome P450, partial [Anaerolineales bacterium]|nr:cytochrome P450 [Anaerolineales bacterium]
MVENVYTQRLTADRADGACPVTALGEAFNPFTDPYISDPYAFYARARADEPVFYSPEIDHWVVSRYEHVKAMLQDTEQYSSRNAQTPIKPWPPEAVKLLTAQEFRLMPNLSNNDPPSHTQVRRFLNDAFTPKRIKWLEPHVRRIVNEAIDAFSHKPQVDLIKELFYETPARVLFTFLGIPESDIERVKAWSAGRALLTWGKLSDAEILAQMPTFIAYIKYCYDLVDRLDREPGDDYTSELLHKLKAEQPEGMDKDRIAITIFGLLMAGHETTTNQSGNGLRTLLQHRDAWEALCQDPGLIPNAVEEIIRHESSVVAWRRVAKRPVTIEGITIPEGAQILVLLGAANRDESQFADAERFDIYRKDARQHVSFGHGIHYCLGAPLARLELKIFLEELTRRLPHMRLVEGQRYQ